jgi:intracellular multiplication protein IcmJ
VATTMEFLPISLTARRGNGQRFLNRKNNKAFQNAAQQVFKRDDYTCRFCGFKSRKYQEVVNIDHNYSNNKFSNLATACSFCSCCLFLDIIGNDGQNGGNIIHLPEISQSDLNHFCRALFCSLLRDAPYKGKLQAVYLSLQDRAKTVEEVFGPGAQEPATFGQCLIDSGLTEDQLKHPILTELKFLPIRKFYKQQAEYWKTTVFANIPL